MNKISKYISSALLFAAASAMLTGCDDDFETPPAYVPQSPYTEANATIAQIRQQYMKSDVNYATEVGLNANGDSIIIKGRVISSDESGNIYKKFVIYDGTSAIPVSINQKELYKNFCFGQEVYVNLTGICVGKYANLFQIGSSEAYQSGTQTSFLSEEVGAAHFFPNGYAYPEKVDTLKTTLAELKTLLADPTTYATTISRLVCINDVYWEDAGAPFATNGSTVNRNICDKAGNSLIVRNSGYSDFFWNILPGGYGSVCGILSQFNNDYQLELIGLNSLIGFDPDARPVGKSLYKQASAVESGKAYAFVADSKIAKTIGGSYGWLYVDEITITDGTFEGPTASAFTFTESGDAYLIQQADGRYLSMEGTYNSFQVKDAPDGDNSLWTVVANGDGTFTITNKGMNKYVQYSPGFSSFGSYPSAQDGGLLPQLFLATE